MQQLKTIKKIDHIVITTANIKKCIDFYEMLGFKSESNLGRYELYAGDFKINVHIKGKELLPHAKNIQTGSADLCFELYANIYDFKKMLEDKKIIIESGIVDRHGTNGLMQSLYIYDPDGNLIEFSSYI